MASPPVKVDTFFKQKTKPFIDSISKIYIITASILGLVRLPVVLNETKYMLTSVAKLYCLILCIGTSYAIYISGAYLAIAPMMISIEYAFHISFSLITWKRVERYYKELNNFDNEMGCRPKVIRESVNNIILMVILNVFFTFTYCAICLSSGWDKRFYFQAVPLNILHSLELFYYGHLLSLIVARLHIINYFVETTLFNGKSIKYPDVEEFRSFNSVKNTDMKKIMDMYYITIKAYDSLVDAIKWQLLVTIMTSFIATLTFCYNFSRCLITAEGFTMEIVNYVDLMVMQMVSLFSPCVFGDRVHGQVRRLRELLASRLYENKLDKRGRSAARALLALTEARDLSFSLLRMLQIDVSLPFKYIGLLVTYLIILVQFEKVINPSAPSTTYTTISIN